MKYIVYKIIRFIFRPIFLLVYRPEYINLENVPSKGRVILAGNHTNILDALIMIFGPKRVVHMMAKKELFNNIIGKWFFKSMACISVDRSIHDSDAKNEAINVLNNDELLGIFPEGTINKTNSVLLPFKYGAVSFASKTNSKIVPFAIVGKYKLFRKNIKIIYGKPYKVNKNLEIDNKLLMKKVEDLIKGVNNYEKK